MKQVQSGEVLPGQCTLRVGRAKVSICGMKETEFLATKSVGYSRNFESTADLPHRSSGNASIRFDGSRFQLFRLNIESQSSGKLSSLVEKFASGLAMPPQSKFSELPTGGSISPIFHRLES